ncbi:peptidylprolyl isomerase, partial [Mycobacterium interjectum]|uniref:peptidylprolyl isomerase n=1 Tax=Mycobacterium interjectum TaxID=33895 RepID=UPI0021F396DA
VPPLPAFAPPARRRRRLPIPAVAGSGEQARQPAAVRQDVHRAGPDPRRHLDQLRRYRDPARQLRVPLHGEQLHQLARQGFFDNTICGRIIDEPDGGTLLFGGGDADGGGGAGYEFADEYPTNQYKADDPALKATVIYPRGTVAMAQSGPNTNESQFFMVYRDAEIEPTSTVFGSVDQAGLDTLDKIAKVGIAGNRTRGNPASTVTINSVRVG